jgi:hypothetical protein
MAVMVITMMNILIESDGRPGLTYVWALNEKGEKIDKIDNVTAVEFDVIDIKHPTIKAKLSFNKVKLKIKAEQKEEV